eukprot:m.112808 g.112808  ORF g.112808 m.112808 type:complete len:161 (-) comp15987_c2_seq3:3643-4125(-)
MGALFCCFRRCCEEEPAQSQSQAVQERRQLLSPQQQQASQQIQQQRLRQQQQQTQLLQQQLLQLRLQQERDQQAQIAAASEKEALRVKAKNVAITETFPIIIQGRGPASDECAICMCTFEIGERLRLLPCLHKYHSDCVDPWLKRTVSCPICNSTPASWD